jgi:hypothetical protein
MGIFFLAVVGGRVIAAFTTKDRNSRQAVTGIAALVIFVVLFFGSRR